ncbi:MAG: carbon-nitrogen hydrolase family protein [Lentisphaerae bacterium]|nr:carbon-nitrogen hydrolase family protein [Lentisphaerota bacterium]
MVCAACAVFGLRAAVPAVDGATAVTCALIQYTYQSGNAIRPDDERLEGMIREAAANGAQIIVAPETYFYREEPWREGRVSMRLLAWGFPLLSDRFSALAAELNAAIVIGLREPSYSFIEPTYNTALFFGPDGTLCGKHRKMRPGIAEDPYTKAGSTALGDARVFATPYGRVGMLICKDMMDDQWSDHLASQGMDLFIGISADQSEGWQKVVDGCRRASCYGIGANQYGNGCGGNSGFVGPGGGVIASVGAGERILYASLLLPSSPREGRGGAGGGFRAAETAGAQAPAQLRLVRAVPAAGNGMVLCWTSASNRTYTIEASADLKAGFTAAAVGIPATPPLNTWTGVVDGAGFFRVREDAAPLPEP